MTAKKFRRTIEDFVCEHCGAFVKGDGYTNHCPRCLWSKHVDVNPGDRASNCKGMMEPVAVEGASPHYRILHRCTKCGCDKRNDMDVGDSTEALLELARKNEPMV
ncbi:MAG TPA: RNHCP domain-containing protein [Candidatus Paceibacterota bacterium]|nr:RNHCP domain-containing protein [Candidatus Paceibacterota bacterium]